MAATAVSSNASTCGKGTIHIYIDNSNLWIQGQKTYAEKKGLDVAYDPTWRFDVGRLKGILSGRCKLQGKAPNFEIKVHLYGSIPPPVDTVWEAMGSHDVEVSTFARSTWSGREKQVDMAMGVQSARQALKDKMNGIQSEFILVSGDRDLYSVVLEIIEDGFPVHVWSWNNCLAKEYRRMQHELVQVHLLDDYLEQIGFRETIFRVDRHTISPHSIVVLEPLSKADEIKSFVSHLNVPVHRYECPTQREGASSKDLVIIPSFAWRMTHVELVNLFKESKAKLEASGLSVRTYSEYCQSSFPHLPTCELAISNRFAELPDLEVGSRGSNEHVDDHDEILDDNRDEMIDANDGFTDVNRSGKQMKKSKKNDQGSRKHCYWGFYCAHETNCKYGHTKNEEEHFKTYGHRRPKKYELCQREDCIFGKSCKFAHSKEELLCTACDTKGHGRNECPAWR